MKIVHIMQYYNKDFTYQENYLPKYQAKNGHEVHIITSKATHNKLIKNENITFYNIEIIDNVTIHRLSTLFEIKGKELIMLRGLKQEVEKINPEIIFLHGATTGTTFQSLITLRNFKNIYIDEHIGEFNLVPFKFYKILFYKFFKIFYCFYSKKVNHFFAIALDQKEHTLMKLLGIDEKNIDILPLGVENEIFKYDDNYNLEIRKKHNILKNEVIIGYAGKFEPSKKILKVIDIFLNIYKDYPNLWLILIGSGSKEYEKEIIRKINNHENIILIPFASSQLLSRYYSAFDIGLWIGNPSITILEAMNCGVCIIAMKNPSINHYNEDNSIILLNNDEEIIPTLKMLLDDKKILKEVAQKSIFTINKNFNWNEIAKRSISLIREYKK